MPVVVPVALCGYRCYTIPPTLLASAFTQKGYPAEGTRQGEESDTHRFQNERLLTSELPWS
jgi:hypothetical protein